MINKKRLNIIYSRGYTLLFAVLVSSLVLVVGVSILTISKKEYQLSASARDSTLAIYAADGALECFAYADQDTNPGEFHSDMACGEDRGTVSISSTDPLLHTLSFKAKMGKGADDNSCADLYVEKRYANNKWSTVIQSRGYSTGWDSNNQDCGKTSAKKVERAIRLSY